MKKISIYLILAVVCTACNPSEQKVREILPPPSDQNLVIQAPIELWDEAIPLGNGLTGGLLWGQDNEIRLSLDRGDLWDERTTGESEWWKKYPWEIPRGTPEYQKAFAQWDGNYNGKTPTKLPGGRLEIILQKDKVAKEFELNLATAEGIAHFTDNTRLRAFYSATAPVTVLIIPGEVSAANLIPAGQGKDAGNAGPSSGGAVKALGYPPAEFGSEEDAKWFVQDAADGLRYCVCIETKKLKNQTLLALTITASGDLKDQKVNDVLSLARSRCSQAISSGYGSMLEPHAAWWRNYWEQSDVSIPEAHLQRYYQFARYLYGAGSRRGAPPMPLQGVWTADNGGLPPWKGDYHNDLNTQMTYIAYFGSGDFESGAAYLDYLWNLRPAFQQFAKDFYGTGGLSSPGVMSLAGQPLGGWPQYSLSPTMTAWNGHLFYLHWRYTQDDTFLRDRAYPWCADAAECLAQLLKPDADGRLALPFSSSPEIHNNSEQAWLKPNSNYDLACMKMLFLSLAEMADALGNSDDVTKWKELAHGLGDFHCAPDGELLLCPGEALRESHRHLSNIMGIFPFNLINIDNEEGRKQIQSSLDAWEKLGTSAWCGYSWAWMGALRARVGDGEQARRDLDIFVRAFVTRNGFHVNGDQTKSGYSSFTYRPMTLEGNFAAMQIVHEMLLQSWSPTPGEHDTEVIRIFPAVNKAWKDVSFNELRAEGGHRVSAKRENGVTTWFRITAGNDGLVRILDNFGGLSPKWDASEVIKNGKNFEIVMKKGQSIEAKLN